MKPPDDGINQRTGNICLYDLLPEEGDSLVVVNKGTYYELRKFEYEEPTLSLTDEDIDSLCSGTVVWH